ncbi:putative sigma-adaptin 3 [Trypanosoma cruzi]|uniref:Putative sigma-adaptin 3 n=1 Tax=Trypanosoma cruzi TaxID=5693 RepID=A0A2V2V237_TRYCR|nr:putative sigma-adaptin 3 [Trypanosoma cruzi]
MIKYLLLISRQGKLRLAKWYVAYPKKEKAKLVREACQLALGRSARFSNVVEHRGSKYICRRYASLYFVASIDKDDNELIVLEVIHHFVEVLDRYFGNVCELDLIFNFHRAYFVLDEVILGGELEDSSKRTILKYIQVHDGASEEIEQAGSNGAAAAIAATVGALKLRRRFECGEHRRQWPPLFLWTCVCLLVLFFSFSIAISCFFPLRVGG